MVSWEYNVQGVDRPIDILGVYRPGSISSNASGVDRPNKWEYIGQGVDRLVIIANWPLSGRVALVRLQKQQLPAKH
jgi:hypothetical protein